MDLLGKSAPPKPGLEQLLAGVLIDGQGGDDRVLFRGRNGLSFFVVAWQLSTNVYYWPTAVNDDDDALKKQDLRLSDAWCGPGPFECDCGRLFKTNRLFNIAKFLERLKQFVDKHFHSVLATSKEAPWKITLVANKAETRSALKVIDFVESTNKKPTRKKGSAALNERLPVSVKRSRRTTEMQWTYESLEKIYGPHTGP
ncbi:hypothetical protein CSKR_111963 [Clonorchis sinensis]|uniref:Uncharacterized protein n=2 Tax=Clonorchis sinensis TaxID=79923 RepID=G7YJI1_CLOSI|nr:hypothetical protein CSKR_111963 [Clonorchis sinensis]GAA53114.1 hypothetical protein CLF_109565 [Clonorchis sinensis]